MDKSITQDVGALGDAELDTLGPVRTTEFGAPPTPSHSEPSAVHRERALRLVS